MKEIICEKILKYSKTFKRFKKILKKLKVSKADKQANISLTLYTSLVNADFTWHDVLPHRAYLTGRQADFGSKPKAPSKTCNVKV